MSESRPRRSTVMVAIAFVATGILYLVVRPQDPTTPTEAPIPVFVVATSTTSTAAPTTTSSTPTTPTTPTTVVTTIALPQPSMRTDTSPTSQPPTSLESTEPTASR